MDFIIYENDERFVQIYKHTILKLMGYSNLNYKITEINSFDEKSKDVLTRLTGNKIYILDIEEPLKNGLDFAKEIRRLGDWTSPIILVTNQEELQNIGKTTKILMLDCISKKKELNKNLFDALTIALEIVSPQKNLCFCTKGELFKIPYQDILYIEKLLNDNASNIVTKTSVFTIRKTIHGLEEELDDSIFFKTHRSFLVNLQNVQHIDFEKGMITFGNQKIALLSRAHKKKLKESMMKYHDSSFVS